jgi:ubiquinone/menaquinone biosynthesis C-methylase UbiE
MSSDAVTKEMDTFIERFLGFASGTFNMFSIYIGDRLGLYRVLSKNGGMTARELAVQSDTNERYIREWLEQQTVAGIISVDDDGKSADMRRYHLPKGHGEPLIDCDSLNFIAPMAQLIAGAIHPLPKVVEAYRSGEGVPFEEFGEDLREGQAAINYPAFWHLLGSEWLPSISDVHKRLQADPPARIADIGCGFGWSSIGMARSYPKVKVDGFDMDKPSIERAKKNAKRNKLDDRVSFEAIDAGDSTLAGKYDLVTAFECVHDMSNPVEALKTMRRLAGNKGAVLVVDERVGDRFTAEGNDVEWMMYGWSILHCLPVGMTNGNGHSHAAGTGTVMRTKTLQKYAEDAGFRTVEVLPIENFFFRFYRLRQ